MNNNIQIRGVRSERGIETMEFSTYLSDEDVRDAVSSYGILIKVASFPERIWMLTLDPTRHVFADWVLEKFPGTEFGTFQEVSPHMLVYGPDGFPIHDSS